MSIVDRALWVMERNSEQALGLNNIADACGVSRSHLANAFGTATGWPVMKYLRARRLTEAARRLAGGASDILTVALEHGYGSHEAFTNSICRPSRFAVAGISTVSRRHLRCIYAKGTLLPRRRSSNHSHL
jgi:AraC-like DNA-binding protein